MKKLQKLSGYDLSELRELLFCVKDQFHAFSHVSKHVKGEEERINRLIKKIEDERYKRLHPDI